MVVVVKGFYLKLIEPMPSLYFITENSILRSSDLRLASYQLKVEEKLNLELFDIMDQL